MGTAGRYVATDMDAHVGTAISAVGTVKTQRRICHTVM